MSIIEIFIIVSIFQILTHILFIDFKSTVWNTCPYSKSENFYKYTDKNQLDFQC